MICRDGDLRWLDVVKSFTTSAYRLEQQLIYVSDVHAGLLDSWLAGQTEPPGPNEWSRMIERKVSAGVPVERVRVFEDEPTLYQQWLKWWSVKNVNAGEQHFYMNRSVADMRGVSHIYDRDFWLLDRTTLVAFTFDRDGKQTVEVTQDPDRLAAAILWWDLAIDACYDGAGSVVV